MSRRNPAHRGHLRLVSDTEALQALAERLAPPDADAILPKTRLLHEIAQLRLKELRAALREP